MNIFFNKKGIFQPQDQCLYCIIQ